MEFSDDDLEEETITDVYNHSDEALENDEISPIEAAFMEGYNANAY